MERHRMPGGNGISGDDGGCGQVAAWLAAYASGDLDEGREGRVRRHLAGCASCRAAAAALDPSLLFLELRGAPLPEAFWTGFRTRLRASLPGAPWWRWRGLPRPAYLAAPLAMLLVLAGTLFVMRPPRQRWLPAGRALRPPQQVPAPAAPPAAQGAPVIEEVGSPKARVYRFTVGGPGDETPIYLVVDEEIDI
jgi:anti-sigma factor RsiW